MKTTLKTCALYLLFALTIHASGDETKCTFQSTYPEGFGKIFQKEMLIRRIPKQEGDQSAAAGYTLSIEGQNPASVNISCQSVSVQKKLDSLFANGANSVRIKAVGYEGIWSRGAPGLCKTSPSEASADYLVPQGDKWRMEKEIVILAFEPA